jgi:hypothetical protein
MKSSRGVLVAVVVSMLSVVAAACVSVGKPFPVEQVPNIQIGRHTPADIEKMFGKPWRTGMEDGETTWQYGDYKRGLFGSTKTRDLVVRFAPNGVVSSYSFNSDQPEDSHIKPKPAEPIF